MLAWVLAQKVQKVQKDQGFTRPSAPPACALRSSTSLATTDMGMCMSASGGEMPAGAVLRMVGYAPNGETATPEDIINLYDAQLKAKFEAEMEDSCVAVFLETKTGVALGMVLPSPSALQTYKSNLRKELIELDEVQKVMDLYVFSR